MDLVILYYRRRAEQWLTSWRKAIFRRFR